MRLKTSCFNPSLGMSSLRRFWPLPVCSFFAFLLSLVLPLYRFLHAEDVTGLFSYQDFSAPVSKSASVSIYLGNLFYFRPYWWQPEHWWQPCCCSITSMARRKSNFI